MLTIIAALDWIIIGGVLASALIMPFERHTETTKTIGFVLPFVCFLLKMALSGRWLVRRTPLDLFIGLYLLTCVIASLFSTDLSESFRLLRKELLPCLILYYLIVNNFNSEQRIKWLLAILAIGGLASLLWGTGNWVWFSGGEVEDVVVNGRLQGSFGQPNRYAQFLLVFGSLSVVLMAIVRNWRWKPLLGALLILIMLNLLWTESRAGWAAFIPTMLVYLLCAGKKQLILALGCCGLFVLIVLATPQGRERLLTSWSIDERHLIYPSALQAFKDHPLTGVGYGDRVYLKEYRNKYQSPQAVVPHSGAHNIFLQAAVETGALGLLAFILLHLKIAGLSLKAYSRHRASEWKWVALWGLSSLVAVFTIGQLHTLYRDRNLCLFWLVVAVVAAVEQLAVRQQEPPRETPQAAAEIVEQTE